jgi:D-beta-D-heptose 7-phosphate kinase/D-beta-D-heptose 1-phosphate adenosyltransferase
MKNYNVLLIGETCKDIFKYGKCSRLNPEAPTPVFLPTKETVNDGMAGNVRGNLIQLLQQTIDVVSQKETIEKIRFVDEHSNYILLRVDNEPELKPLTIEYLNKGWYCLKLEQYDLVVVSDYHKGYISDDVLKYIIDNSKISFVDTKRVISDWAENVTYLKINQSEFENPQHSELLKTKYYNKTIVTMAKDGCRLGDKHFPGKPVDVIDVVGAGDTYLAAVATKYLMCGNIHEAMKFANECSSYVVTQKGVALPNCKLC